MDSKLNKRQRKEVQKLDACMVACGLLALAFSLGARMYEAGAESN